MAMNSTKAAGATREQGRRGRGWGLARRLGNWGKEGRPRSGKSNIVVAILQNMRYSYLAIVVFVETRYGYK